MSNRKISLCLTTFNRFECTLESFVQVATDERISEIVIVDDCSDIEIYKKLETAVSFCPKVKLFRNTINLDCFFNKCRAIELASNDWVIIIDSDNVLTREYIDKIFSIPEWDENTIYTPDFASPHFDFREYSGVTVSKENISEWIDRKHFETMLNACNYFVNKNEYLRVWDGTINPVTSDSIFVCLNWLKAGNKIEVVKGLQYFHRVWEQSHYREKVSITPKGLHQNILEQLRNLK